MQRGWLNLFLALVAIGFVSPTGARADSWALPRTEVYVSADGSARLTVTPRVPSSQLAYFEDRVAGRTPAGQRPGETQAGARGSLERRGADGRWTQVWEGSLVNEVAPVSAVVGRDGAYFVTFDNWHSLGWGNQVVVVYDSTGRRIRALGLADFLPQSYVEALPHTTSSIHWGGEHRIEGDQLILQVAIPSQSIADAREHVELALDLVTGQPVAPSGSAWENALAVAARVHAANDAAEAEERAFFTSALRAPASASEGAWHRYVVEAYFRLDPGWADGFPAAVVLRVPQAADYRQSLPWLRDALRNRDLPTDALMLASPDQDNLAAVLAAEVPRLRRGALRGVRLYVVADDARWPRFAAILAPTGAQLIQIDPAEPIPQRPERLRRFLGGE